MESLPEGGQKGNIDHYRLLESEVFSLSLNYKPITDKMSPENSGNSLQDQILTRKEKCDSRCIIKIKRRTR